MGNEANQNNVSNQGDVETNEKVRLTSQLDDSIGLSQNKLRNSEVHELTFS